MKRKFDKELFTVHSSVGSISLFSLLLPLLFETVMNHLQGTINTAVLSNYSEVSASAVGSVNTVFNVLLLVGSVLSTGATVVVSNLIGEERIGRAREASFTTLTVGLLAGLFITPVCLAFSPDLIRFLHLEGALFEDGVTYFRLRMCFIVFTMLTSSVLALLKCYGYPKYTFLIGFITNVLNLLFNVFVLYCPEISPVTGVAGVALGCGFSNLIGFGVALFLLFRLGIRLSVPKSLSQYFGYLGHVLRIGVPSGISSATFAIVTMVTTSFVPLLGDSVIAAKVYSQNVLCYAYLFSVSAGNANALLVGRRYGAGEYDKIAQMNRALVRITRAVNLGISSLLLLFYRPLIGIFTSDASVITLCLGVFAVDIITEQARANSQVYEYALRAAGDVMFTTAFVIGSCIACGLGLAYFLAIPCGLGLIGLWIGLAADETVRAVVSYFRFRSGRWRTLRAKREADQVPVP
ncbi:MAG: MATE family efflux transporter [Clostridia bacterium]|nr:MATE family efflux transporter [Clostridia bacterium]